jgi:glutamyl-tRNA synthetase
MSKADSTDPSNAPCRTRFAPSPTGVLHVGGARTALYSWLTAKHSGGEMILRIEDTDLERSDDAHTNQILDALLWLGLDYSGSPVSQVSRGQLHAQALEKLIDSGKAYFDSATAADVKAWKEIHGKGVGYRGQPSADQSGAIRLRLADSGQVVVNDMIRGPITFDIAALDDFVIARSDRSVLYNFAAAVDDAEMGITQVIRGDDHISNTPRQILILEALGYTAPAYAHVPLLHGPDGAKLSKRHGAASVQELRDKGYIPEAVRNYMALLGWGPGDDETLISTDEMISRFDPEDIGKSAAIFDEKKLRWMNGRYMRELELDDYCDRAEKFLASEGHDNLDPDLLRVACSIAQEKAQTYSELWPLIGYLFEEQETDPKDWRKTMKGDAKVALETSLHCLNAIDQDQTGFHGDGFTVESVSRALEPISEQLKISRGKVYLPIRVALTGTRVSPGIFESVAALGRDKTIKRIKVALKKLEQTETSG